MAKAFILRSGVNGKDLTIGRKAKIVKKYNDLVKMLNSSTKYVGANQLTFSEVCLETSKETVVRSLTFNWETKTFEETVWKN